MYREHRNCEIPPNNDQSIWRYIDFSKFVDLIITNELYFTRIDKLEDGFEGSHTLPTVKSREIYFNRRIETGELSLEEAERSKKILETHYEKQRQYFAVNCWHMSDYESAAMWALYSKDESGIAIRSSFSKLRDSFDESPIDIHIGIVKYVDYLKDLTSWGNGFIPILLKGKSFDFERELRVLCWRHEAKNEQFCGSFEHGVRIKVDTNVLIDSIFVAPYIPKWKYDLMKALLLKFNLNVELHYSALEGKPVY